MLRSDININGPNDGCCSSAVLSVAEVKGSAAYRLWVLVVGDVKGIRGNRVGCEMCSSDVEFVYLYDSDGWMYVLDVTWAS